MFKTKKRTLTVILSLLLAFAFAVTAHAVPAQNADGYYQLATVDDMLWFRDQVAAGEVGINAMLMNDIDLSRVVWSPIWYEDLFAEQEFNFAAADSSDIPYWYAGTFDGNGKKITLDTYNNSTFNFPANPDYVNPNPIQAGGGLFMGISDTAVVKNFTMTGKMTLAGFPSEANVRIFAAPIVSKNKGTIYNVKVENFTIENNGASSASIIGAFSALSWGKDAMIDRCSVENVEIYSAADGGLLALIAAQVCYGAVVKNCDVTDSLIQNGAGGYTAGIAALVVNESIVMNCSVSSLDLTSPSSATAAETYMGGIVAHARTDSTLVLSGDEAHTWAILNSSASDVTMRAKKNDDSVYAASTRVGGIAGFSMGSRVGVPGLIQGCSAANITIEASSSYINYIGGITGGSNNTQVLQCRVVDVAMSALHSDASANTASIQVGGITGHISALLAMTKTMENISECLVDGVSIDVRSESNKQASYYVGAIVGLYSTSDTISGDYFVQNCAATGNIHFAVTTDNGIATNNAHIGGLVGRNYGAKVHDNVMGNFTIASADVNGATNWYIGKLAGSLRGYANINRGELSGDIYDQRLDTTFGAGKLAGITTGAENVEWYISGISTFDGTDPDPDNIATLFVSFFQGGEVELAQGATLELELEAFAGTLGIDLDAVTWTSSNPDVLSVTPASGANVTIAALAPGTATLTCSYELNGEEKELTLTVVVPETPEYAEVTPTVTGTPEDGFIYEGEAVNLTYNFDPYTAIPDIDNTGMDLSGLLAAIVDGKVVVTGTAGPAGTYYYVVTLQGADDSIITQRVYVTIQGGSRPFSNPTGGGSSNCNAGMGIGALVSLLGLALVMKRK